MRKSEQLYTKLERLLIAKGYITQNTSDVICRRGTRKESYWKRHILDLCEFVLDMCTNIDSETEAVLEKAIELVKS